MGNILRNPEEPAGVLAFVGSNLRRLRLEAGLSQQALADASGVSRRMLVSLERGDTNISLSSLDRIAVALGVSFVALVSDPAAQQHRINALAWKGRSKDSRAVLLGSVAATQEAQLWSWSLAPGDRYQAEPDPVGWHEMVYVTQGVLTLQFEERQQVVHAGDHAIFSSAQQYAYLNESDGLTVFVRTCVM